MTDRRGGDGQGVPPRFFFVHLQKTAGTALFRRLRHHFGTEAVYPRPDEQGTPEVVLGVERLRARLAEEPGAFEVVTGHFPLAVVELLPPGCRTFTLLRDPVERTLSFLRHQREVDPRFAGSSLGAIYDDPVSTSGLLRNHQVKMLSMSPEEMTDGALSPIVVGAEHVERAKANLRDRIDVFGLQEEFEAFCEDLASTFGWDLGEPVFMNRTKPAPVDDGLRERIERDNHHDLELYGFARTLWSKRHRR